MAMATVRMIFNPDDANEQNHANVHDDGANDDNDDHHHGRENAERVRMLNPVS